MMMMMMMMMMTTTTKTALSMQFFPPQLPAYPIYPLTERAREGVEGKLTMCFKFTPPYAFTQVHTQPPSLLSQYSYSSKNASRRALGRFATHGILKPRAAKFWSNLGIRGSCVIFPTGPSAPTTCTPTERQSNACPHNLKPFIFPTSTLRMEAESSSEI